MSDAPRPFNRSAAVTRSLLGYGVLAGPFYLMVGILQGVLRDGFDFSKHALSHLANGEWGWIQTSNLALTGLMVVAAAVGVVRVIGARARAAGILLGLFGVGMIGSAIFRADPVAGFPPDTPDTIPATLSTPGLLHFAIGGLGFVALATSALLMAFIMKERGQPRLAWLSVFSSLSIVGGFFAPMLGLRSPVLGIWYAVVVGWIWLLVLSLHLYRVSPSPDC